MSLIVNEKGAIATFETPVRSQTSFITAMSVLIFLESVTFLFAALSHLGIPLGFSEPRILPAAIVEGLCGLFLAASTYALFARRAWAWGVTLAAHLFAVAGVLLGIVALALGLGPSTEVNTIYHRIILVVLVAVVILLLTLSVRAHLRQSRPAKASR